MIEQRNYKRTVDVTGAHKGATKGIEVVEEIWKFKRGAGTTMGGVGLGTHSVKLYIHMYMCTYMSHLLQQRGHFLKRSPASSTARWSSVVRWRRHCGGSPNPEMPARCCLQEGGLGRPYNCLEWVV